jgi:V/A-type H+-transporting ATPase subunit I
MIVPMKKASIVVMKEDKENLLKSLQRFGDLMIISDEDSHSNVDLSQDENYLSRVEKSIKIVKQYEAKRSLFDYTVVDYSDFINVDPKRMELVKQVEQANDEIAKLNNEVGSLKDKIKVLQPWKDLDINLSMLKSTKYAYLNLGFLESNKINDFLSSVSEKAVEVVQLGVSSEGQALLIASYYEDYDAVMTSAKNYGFIEVTLPSTNKYVSEMIIGYEEEIKECEAKIEKLKEELTNLAKSIKEIELLNDQLASEIELKKSQTTQTLETIYIQGWVRSDKIDELTKAIESATSIFDLEVNDPAEGELPPTYLKNNQFVEPFEAITDMFSKPSPYEVDPNPVMSIWYWITFGMMMGDAGYGLVMFIIFFLMIKLKKPKGGTLKLLKILLYSSITTIIWGVLFNSYFGFPLLDKPPLVDPINEPLNMLIISLIYGALHILTALVVKFYKLWISKDYLGAFYDAVSWMLIIIGLGLVGLGLVVPAVSMVGIILASVGALTVVLTAGRSKKNIFSRLGSGLWALYGVTGYMSDILSYSRILALVLSSAVIGMVMNQLAGMIQGSIVGIIASIFIYIIGHVFNLVMGLLSAYVHAGRLQYIEFFGKFFDGGGYDFKPLSIKLKYVNEVNDKVMKGEN